MNARMVARILGTVLFIFAALLLLPAAVALIYGERVLNFVIPAALSAFAGFVLTRFTPHSHAIFSREGFTSVGLAWISMGLFGALPFVISGDIPNYIDALFETASGLTTTGATIMTDVEAMSRGGMFWRMFTHWIGGMGVLVFIMAVLPMGDEHSMHIMRAEVPGPTVGKLVPKARDTARILYIIYAALTAIETVFLMCGGMSFYEALLHAFATAGTGGFSTRNASVAAFNSVYIEMVIAVFLMLFGINFNLYYFVIIGRSRARRYLPCPEMPTRKTAPARWIYSRTGQSSSPAGGMCCAILNGSSPESCMPQRQTRRAYPPRRSAPNRQKSRKMRRFPMKTQKKSLTRKTAGAILT